MNNNTNERKKTYPKISYPRNKIINCIITTKSSKDNDKIPKMYQFNLKKKMKENPIHKTNKRT